MGIIEFGSCSIGVAEVVNISFKVQNLTHLEYLLCRFVFLLISVLAAFVESKFGNSILSIQGGSIW